MSTTIKEKEGIREKREISRGEEEKEVFFKTVQIHVIQSQFEKKLILFLIIYVLCAFDLYI